MVFILFLLELNVLNAPLSAAESCKYKIDDSSVKAGWTAFKTRDKALISGTFKSVHLSHNTSSKSVTDLFSKTKITMDLFSSDSSNSLRDKNIKDFFKEKIKNAKITAEIVQIDPDGKATMLLSFNSVKKKIPVRYSVKNDDYVEFSGDLDLLDFKVGADFQKESGGVSKNWSLIAFKASSKITKTCD